MDESNEESTGLELAPERAGGAAGGGGRVGRDRGSRGGQASPHPAPRRYGPRGVVVAALRQGRHVVRGRVRVRAGRTAALRQGRHVVTLGLAVLVALVGLLLPLPLGAASPLVAASHRLHLALRPVK